MEDILLSKIKSNALSRQGANLKIADILKGTEWHFEGNCLKELAEKFPQQRAGQLICNYIHPQYRHPNAPDNTRAFLEYLFPGDPDPFYEESVVTLKRLINYIKNGRL